MTRTSIAPLVLAFVVVALLTVFALFGAHADQGLTSPTQIAAGQGACDLTDVAPQKVTTSGSSAATSTVTGKGKVRVICSARAFMKVGAAGVTGVTAGTATGNGIAANVPEYFWSRGSQFAFIQDTGAGVCEVAECK
jgi:hypothetical protein